MCYIPILCDKIFVNMTKVLLNLVIKTMKDYKLLICLSGSTAKHITYGGEILAL